MVTLLLRWREIDPVAVRHLPPLPGVGWALFVYKALALSYLNEERIANVRANPKKFKTKRQIRQEEKKKKNEAQLYIRSCD